MTMTISEMLVTAIKILSIILPKLLERKKIIPRVLERIMEHIEKFYEH